jgi:hypothetical protein
MKQIRDFVRKIADWNNPRDTYEVPVLLLKTELPIDGVIEEAVHEGVQNQLGALVDLTINVLLPAEHPRKEYLRALREQLWAKRQYTVKPFYTQEPKAVTDFNTGRTSQFLKPWNLIGALTPEKFKEQFELGYEDKQATARSYSQGH